MRKEWGIPSNDRVDSIYREERRRPSPRNGFGYDLEEREDRHDNQRDAIDVRHERAVPPRLNVVASSLEAYHPR